MMSKKKKVVEVLLILVIGIIFTNIIYAVCCPETSDGAICQDIDSSETDNCAVSTLPSSCENVGSCQPGCCIDSEEGLCSPRSTEAECAFLGGEWRDQESCLFRECKKNCCILGDEVRYVTDKRCEKLSADYGVEKDFRQLSGEIECLALSASQRDGACLFSSGACQRLTEKSCLEKGGEFSGGHLCTSEELNTSCQPTNQTTCFEGKDGVYFLDSCGNPANIYDSSKVNNEEYWEEIISSENSCNSDSGNINSASCGNCDRYRGSECANKEETGSEISLDYGNNYCMDLNCNEAPDVVDAQGDVLKTKDRINGESWCVYDSQIGEGLDTVGSRHWKYYCQDGEVVVEGCADYRQEICVERRGDIQGRNLSVAECKTNDWRNCIGYNSDEELSKSEREKMCSDNEECYWSETQIGDSALELCAPKYPSGFKFWEKREGDKKTEAEKICSYANQTCRVVFVCGDCEVNCHCLTDEFTEGMNNLCMSMGDCGAGVNVMGKLTKGGYTIRHGKKIGEEYIKELISLKNVLPLNKIIFYNHTQSTRGYNLERNHLTHGDADGSQFGMWRGDKPGWRKYVDTVFFILSWIWGGWSGDCDVDRIDVKYTCLSWQPPVNNQSCELCNNNSLKSCTEYRCKSLGAGCRLINKNSHNPTCIKTKNDSIPPKLSPGKILEGFKFKDSVKGDEKFSITQENGECIPEFTPVNFTLETDEYAQCKIAFNHTNRYEDMQEYFGDSNLFLKEHPDEIFMPSLESLKISNVRGNIKESFGNLKFFVRCQDVNGNKNIKEYGVDFCIRTGEDLTAARPIKFQPPSESYLKYGKNETNLTVTLNEPAECRYGLEDKNYSSMENNLVCNTNLENHSSIGWECKTRLRELGKISENQIKYYIKCKDQPWFKETINESQRNINTESFQYIIKKSASELEIHSITPENEKEIEAGFTPYPVTLSVRTTGGAENGKSFCELKMSGSQDYSPFAKTSSNKHEQLFDQLVDEKYKIFVRCEDVAGNVAEGKTEFEVELDNEPPKVIRAFNQGDSLKIVTNEEAKCYYNLYRCNFDIDSNSSHSMSTGFSKEHRTDSSNRKYYIKCEDMWGRSNDGCAMIASPIDIGLAK